MCCNTLKKQRLHLKFSEKMTNGRLDICKRARKWDKWDKFCRLSAMFADAVGGRVRIANVDKPEENMQNEMKTPTCGLGLGRSDWCGAENWKRGTGLLAGGGSQLSDEGGFSTGVTCAAPCQLALSVSRWGLSREFYQRLVFSFFLHQEHLGLEDTSQMSVCWCE